MVLVVIAAEAAVSEFPCTAWELHIGITVHVHYISAIYVHRYNTGTTTVCDIDGKLYN